MNDHFRLNYPVLILFLTSENIEIVIQVYLLYNISKATDVLSHPGILIHFGGKGSRDSISDNTYSHTLASYKLAATEGINTSKLLANGYVIKL